MLKAVIFDVDGTLVDTVMLHARAWSEVFRQYGRDVAVEEVRQQIGKGGDQLMPVFLDRELLAEKGEEIERARAELFKKSFLPLARGFPGVRQLFEKIRTDGRRIALASSCKSDELGSYMDLADIRDLVDVKATSDDADRSKPHPDIFEAALEALNGITAANAIVVGDTPYDAEAAGKIGLRSVGLLTGGFSESELRAAGCIAVYGTPEHLLSEYGSSPLA
jgi:HAD superfamily hydrolase (TIGR01509 family)